MDTTSSILSTINSLFSSLFSSIDSSIYNALDKIAFIDSDILTSTYFERLFGSSKEFGILVIANAILVGFILYFAINNLLSSFAITKSQNPYKFILKLIFIGICMNCSFFICEQLINLNTLISCAIREVGKSLLETDICFSKLIDISDSIILVEETSSNIFSIDGIIKTVLSVGLLNLIFVYSIRYILLKVFILLSPFAILSLSLPETSFIFKSWIKCFISLLFIELFSSLILLVTFSIHYSSSDIISKLLFIGSIFSLMKANNYVRDFIGGITIDIYSSFHNMKGTFNSK